MGNHVSELTKEKEEIDLVYLLLASICVVCAALAAGMTVGLLSLDVLRLKIKILTGTESEKKAARRILPILLSNHHLLLCTLLLFNSVANEALPIFLDKLVPSYIAIIISVTLVLIFGEVLPSALFTGKRQLEIASRFTSLIKFLKFIFFPVAYPMACVLDFVLGVADDGEAFNRAELAAMVQIIQTERISLSIQQETGERQYADSPLPPQQHIRNTDKSASATAQHHSSKSSSSAASLKKVRSDSTDFPVVGEAVSHPRRGSTYAVAGSSEGSISDHEITVIGGVLGLAHAPVRSIVIPLDQVDMLSSNQILNAESIKTIEGVGHSRLPVFKDADRKHIIGFFLVKRLMIIDPNVDTHVSSLKLNNPIVVGADDSLLDTMVTFQKSASHLALVSPQPLDLLASIAEGTAPTLDSAPIGIITIEDIFEAMLQSDIKDEADFAAEEELGLRETASLQLRRLNMNSPLSYPPFDEPIEVEGTADGVLSQCSPSPRSESGTSSDELMERDLVGTKYASRTARGKARVGIAERQRPIDKLHSKGRVLSKLLSALQQRTREDSDSDLPSHNEQRDGDDFQSSNPMLLVHRSSDPSAIAGLDLSPSGASRIDDNTLDTGFSEVAPASGPGSGPGMRPSLVTKFSRSRKLQERRSISESYPLDDMPSVGSASDDIV